MKVVCTPVSVSVLRKSHKRVKFPVCRSYQDAFKSELQCTDLVVKGVHGWTQRILRSLDQTGKVSKGQGMLTGVSVPVVVDIRVGRSSPVCVGVFYPDPRNLSQARRLRVGSVLGRKPFLSLSRCTEWSRSSQSSTRR